MRQKTGIICFDAGGTTFRAALVSEDLRIVGSVIEQPSPSQEPAEAIYHTFSQITTRLQSTATENGYTAKIISIGIAGPADYDKGIIKITPEQKKFGQLYNHNLKQAVEQAAGLRTILGNDAKNFALGVGTDYPHGKVGVVTLGTGLGSGFLQNGLLVTTGNGVPLDGEIWNIPYKNKHLEDYISQRAILRYYEEYGGAPNTTVDHMAQAARTGDHAAKKTFEKLAEEIGEGLALAFGEFNPETIVFGGNISQSFDLFGERAARIYASKLSLKAAFIQAKNPVSALLGATRRATNLL